jgi:hypothetical protein
MVVARSEGGEVVVNGGGVLRGRRGRGQWWQRDNDQEQHTDDLRKMMVMVCSGAGDEVAVSSGARIEDGRWQRWRDGF